MTLGLLNNAAFLKVWDAGHIPVTEDFHAYVKICGAKPTLSVDFFQQGSSFRQS